MQQLKTGPIGQEELVLPSKLEKMSEVEKLCRRISRRSGLDEDSCDNLAIAITELVNNAMVHGNQLDPTKKVYIRVQYFADAVRVSIEDEGPGFQVEELPDPTTPQNLWKENGRGIYLVRNLVDQVEFHQTSRGMEIVITEFLKPPRAHS